MKSKIDYRTGKRITYESRTSFDRALKLKLGAYDVGYEHMIMDFDNPKEATDFTVALSDSKIFDYVVENKQEYVWLLNMAQ